MFRGKLPAKLPASILFETSLQLCQLKCCIFLCKKPLCHKAAWLSPDTNCPLTHRHFVVFFWLGCFNNKRNTPPTIPPPKEIYIRNNQSTHRETSSNIIQHLPKISWTSYMLRIFFCVVKKIPTLLSSTHLIYRRGPRRFMKLPKCRSQEFRFVSFRRFRWQRVVVIFSPKLSGGGFSKGNVGPLDFSRGKRMVGDIWFRERPEVVETCENVNCFRGGFLEPNMPQN